MSQKIKDNWKNGICLQRVKRFESMFNYELDFRVYVAMNEKYIITTQQGCDALYDDENAMIIWNRLTLETERVTFFLIH